MAFRLTEPQAQLIGLIERQLAQKATPQLRFFWKKLRSAALPEIPKRRRGQDSQSYALEQVRWQRLASLSAESYVAAAQLLRDEVALIGAVEATQGKENMTPTEAAAALEEAVLQAPLKVRYAIYQRLLATNPDWAE